MYYSLILLFLHQESHLFMRFLLLFARKIVPLQRELRHCKGNKNDKINVIKSVNNCYRNGII